MLAVSSPPETVMTAAPSIGIILSTTRQGRFADKAAAWLQSLVAQRTDLRFELVDLRNYPLPMYDWPGSPARMPIDRPDVLPWRNKIAGLDGFIFVTAEYNHSVPAVLKNAIDHVFIEWQRKPAAFVGYGNAGGARAVEHLRNIVVELQMAPMRVAVHMHRDAILPVVQQGRNLDEFPYLADHAKLMLDDLSWWAWTLKAGRETPVPQI